LLNSVNRLSVITEMQCPISEIGDKCLNVTTYMWELGAGLGICFKLEESTQNIAQKLAEPIILQN
jgi:hypothetical protein